MLSGIDIKNITDVLDAMIQYELLLSDFYKRCSIAWTEDLAFWNNLATAEIRHANNIKQIKDIIVSKSDNFAMGRPFNLTALGTAAAWLKDIVKRLALGEFPQDKILIIARDIEQSLLESNYAEVVKTSDVGYNTRMKEILSQTRDHKKIIQEKITTMNTRT